MPAWLGFKRPTPLLSALAAPAAGGTHPPCNVLSAVHAVLCAALAGRRWGWEAHFALGSCAWQSAPTPLPLPRRLPHGCSFLGSRVARALFQPQRTAPARLQARPPATPDRQRASPRPRPPAASHTAPGRGAHPSPSPQWAAGGSMDTRGGRTVRAKRLMRTQRRRCARTPGTHPPHPPHPRDRTLWGAHRWRTPLSAPGAQWSASCGRCSGCRCARRSAARRLRGNTHAGQRLLLQGSSRLP